MIDGVILTPLKSIKTDKGDVYHALKCTDNGYSGFGEAYFSEIVPGAIKGWKRHNRMTLNLIVINNAVGFVIYDDRADSPTKGCYQEIVLSRKDNYQRLTIAPGLWVAFYCASKQTAMLMDIIPEPHNPDEADRLDISEIKYKFQCTF